MDSTLAPECQSCGYELTGMKIGEACPECGNEIRTLISERESNGWATLGLVLGTCTVSTMALGIVFKLFTTGTYTMAAGDGLTCLTMVLCLAGLVVSVPNMLGGLREGRSPHSRTTRMAVIGVLLSLVPLLLATSIFVFIMVTR